MTTAKVISGHALIFWRLKQMRPHVVTVMVFVERVVEVRQASVGSR
jgi:hypothetical protein